MDSTPLVRLRWRLSGAWLWPSFIVLTLADAAILHDLPLTGDTESLAAAWILGAITSLLGIACLGGLVGMLVRRLRSDMPRAVARNYGGTLVTLVVTLTFLAGGIAHHHIVLRDRVAIQDAVARAVSYIDDHAPAQFRDNLRQLVTVSLTEPVIYRSCVPNLNDDRQYCVVVNRREPFGRSVTYAGAESNATLEQGVN